MWMGTRNGLDRYDGYEFRNYRNDPGSDNSLSSNDIRVVVATTNGIVWAGSHAAGLDRFDSKTGTAINFGNTPGGSRDIGSNHISVLIVDSTGDIWAGTRGGGLAHIDAETLQVRRFHASADGMAKIPSDDVRTIFEDIDGRIWAGTNVGLIVAKDRDSGFGSLELEMPDATGPGLVASIVQNTRKEIFFTTSDGLLLKLVLEDDGSVGSHEIVLDMQFIAFNNSSTLTMDKHDRIWLTGRTVLLYDTILGQIASRSGGYNPYYEDRSGVIWAANAPGFSRLDPANLVFGDYLDDAALRDRSANVNSMFAMLESIDGSIWMSGVDGVFRQDADTGEFTHYAIEFAGGPDPNDTNALYEDLHGIVWGGTYSTGINRVDPVNNEISPYHLCEVTAETELCNRVWVIHGDEQGNLWAGSGNSLVILDRTVDRFVPVNIPAGPQRTMIASGVRALALDNEGMLWIGTQSGLVGWRHETGDWKYLSSDPASNESLTSNYINSLHADNEGGLWIGTQLGAHRLDLSSGTIQHFNTSNGLPNDDIHSIVEDIYGTIWMSTGDGLVSLDKNGGEIRILNKDDGLSSEEFLLAAGHAGRSGNVYFSGENGTVYFDPKMLVDNNEPPPVAFTELRVNNEIATPDSADPDAILKTPVNLSQSIVLPYYRTNVAVEFAALDYSNSSLNSYAYQLVGYDGNWINVDSSRRIASYTNLPFGNYTLRVKAANKYGVWNDAGASLDISVSTPLWRTWWAYLLYSVASIVLLDLLIRLRTRSITNKAAVLEQTVADRTRQIRQNEQKIQSQADHLEDLLD